MPLDPPQERTLQLTALVKETRTERSVMAMVVTWKCIFALKRKVSLICLQDENLITHLILIGMLFNLTEFYVENIEYGASRIRVIGVFTHKGPDHSYTR